MKIGTKVFGTVYGHGEVVANHDGHYTFEVEYQNGQRIPYDENGVPGWQMGNLGIRTVFKESEFCVLDYSFEPNDELLTPKQIIALRNEKLLEVRCPSGLWVSIDKCPSDIVEENLESGNFHLFRKAK